MTWLKYITIHPEINIGLQYIRNTSEYIPKLQLHQQKVQAQRHSIGENSKLLTSIAPHPSPIPGVGPSLSFNSLDYTRHHSKDTRSIQIYNAHFSSFGENMQTLR